MTLGERSNEFVVSEGNTHLPDSRKDVMWRDVEEVVRKQRALKVGDWRNEQLRNCWRTKPPSPPPPRTCEGSLLPFRGGGSRGSKGREGEGGTKGSKGGRRRGYERGFADPSTRRRGHEGWLRGPFNPFEAPLRSPLKPPPPLPSKPPSLPLHEASLKPSFAGPPSARPHLRGTSSLPPPHLPSAGPP